MRFAPSFAALALVLGASQALADNYCPRYFNGALQPDEMTSAASQAKAEATRTCVCDAACSPFCGAWDFANGGPQCVIGDPALFVFLGGDVIACEACKAIRCSDAINACMADGPISGS